MSYQHDLAINATTRLRDLRAQRKENCWKVSMGLMTIEECEARNINLTQNIDFIVKLSRFVLEEI